jgi:uncharacterized membrane protein
VSDYNPYAAPIAEVAGNGEVPPRGEPQPWEVGEAIRSGWELYKAHWAPLTFGYFVIALVGELPGQVGPTLTVFGTIPEGSRTYYAVHVPLSILGWLIGRFFMAGFTRAALRAVRANDASFGDFFAAGGRFVPFVVMSFLKTLATLAGLALLIVPGIIVGLGFANASFFVMDQRLGPVASLRESWRSTEGQKGKLFILSLAEIGLMIVGLVACCLGFFVVVPVMMLARAIVYTKMSGTAAVPSPPAGPLPGPELPPYGGGYGPYGQWGPPGGGQS